MKKIISKFLALIMVFMSFFVCVNADSTIKVYIDNQRLSSDVEPFILSNRTMVPMRAIFESLGASVLWDGNTQTVTSYTAKHNVQLRVGYAQITVDGTKKQLDVAPVLHKGRTMVPARAVAEAFDCVVAWDGIKRLVNITTGNNGYDSFHPNTNTQVLPQTIDKAPIVYLNEWKADPTRTVKVACTNLIRGEYANSIVSSENRFNDKPTSSQEWVIMEFYVEYISSTNGQNDMMKGSNIIYKDMFYTQSKQEITVYDTATWTYSYDGYGVFDVKLYPGQSGKIVIGLLVDKNIGNLLLRVPNKNAGTQTWIPCLTDADADNNSYNNPYNNV